MKIPSNEKWKEIANRFYELWNLPNCLGAIDGKHVRIQNIPNSGSTNYNYKHYHSIVLLAVCDADGLFTMIETGYAGRNNDGGIFRASNLGQCLERNGLNLPASACLPHDESQEKVPYFFVGDNAFPFKRYLMRPFPIKTLDNKKGIFNYRLSRG
ncbi:putative nuclease HARBI1 [Anthonomus grandis grandis]|uniref:putative nuclease HARBI1 n=1 Tax=Anthonomus grandis grandis TaxID=2921223 RepID=UPI00216624CD|nr:putative nuclease HARBI1 [Anthonomus grandis grandis]